ncbi:MAG: hypothetical protein JST30_02010 [Armatimonadetes bacterium]|nr:hypothetical protein [Armatimonadota bacterium]
MLAIAAAAMLAVTPVQDSPQPAPTPIRMQLTAGPGGSLSLVVKNANRRSLNVNFGISLANGSAHYPTNLLLTIVDGAKSRTLPYARGRGVVGGRTDDFVVPFFGQSSYEFRLDVSDFAELHDGPVTPVPETFRAFVSVVSKPLEHVNLDTQGLKHMELFQGEAASNIVDIDLAKKGTR